MSEQSTPDPEPPTEPTDDVTTVGAGTVVALGCTLVTILIILVGIAIALIVN